MSYFSSATTPRNRATRGNSVPTDRRAQVTGRAANTTYVGALFTACGYDVPSFGCGSFLLLCILGFIAGLVLLILHFTCQWMPSSSCSSSNSPLYPLSPNEAETVQYAGFMNNLQAAYYARGQALFNTTAFNSSGFNPAIYTYMNTILAAEQSNVQTMTNLLSSNGLTINPACSYTFTSALTVPAYVAMAATIANYVEGGYLGLINSFNNLNTKLLFTSIGMIQSQQHGYLMQNINGTNTSFPFPASPAVTASTAYTPSQVYTALGALYSCSYTPLPTVAVEINGVALNGTNQTANTGVLANGSSLANVTYTVAYFQNDFNALNFLLGWENLMSTFYSDFQTIFAASDFEGVSGNLTQLDYSDFAIMGGRHAAQVTYLNSVITTRTGGNGVGACPQYNFTAVSNISVSSYVAQAVVLEHVVKQMYIGVIPTLIDTNLQPALAAMGYINGKQFAYVNQIYGHGPASTINPVSSYLTPAQAFVILQSYTFNNCTNVNNLVLPKIITTVPQNMIV